MMRFFNTRMRKLAAALTVATLAFSILLIPADRTNAADHGDSPANAVDRQADINDVYAFLDPNDNTKVVLIMTTNGFIVPAEGMNFGIFDHNLRYRLELETNGDAVADHFIDVTFSEKITSGATPQVATVSSTFFNSFTGNSTPANLSPTSPTPTIASGNGISFYAGLADDPFFFDIPAFSRFVGSVVAGTPDPTQFQRGRDSFAGYGTLTFALSIPVTQLSSLLSGGAANQIGVAGRTQRRALTGATSRRPVRGGAAPFTWVDADRAGVPAVNTALVPFPRKNEYNLSNGSDDAAGRFAPSIIATLQLLGSNSTTIGTLASVAVARGDYLRLNLTTANTGTGGGTNTGAGFPNGRRLADDVIDTILTIIANGATLGDSVNANDVPFRNEFPFVAPAPQPFATGTTDDRTRN